jgi:hypothetical protein
LHYTVSGIITRIGGRPVHRLREDWRYIEMHGQQNIKIYLSCLIMGISKFTYQLEKRVEMHMLLHTSYIK